MILDKKAIEESIKLALDRVIKIGEVSSVDYKNATARVVFSDEDDAVSYDLQVMQKNTVENKDYVMPDVGEEVICLFLPCGDADGFILGSVYAGEITPPETSKDKRTVVFSDNTKISYDRSSHTLSATIGGVSIIADQKNVKVAGAELVDIAATTINLNGDVNIGGNVNITGDTNITGGVIATNDVVAAGKSLSLHTHKDSQNGNTTPPQ